MDINFPLNKTSKIITHKSSSKEQRVISIERKINIRLSDYPIYFFLLLKLISRNFTKEYQYDKPMKEDPMMTTFFPAAAAAILLASSGVRSENTFSRSTPGIGSTRGLKW